MKIAFLTSLYFPNVGGVEYATKRITDELMKRGHTCYIITTSIDKNSPNYEHKQNLHIIRLSSLYMPGTNEKLRIIPFGVQKLRDILFDISPDIIHAQDSLMAMLARRVYGKHSQTPIFVGIHTLPENLFFILNLPQKIKPLVVHVAYKKAILGYNIADFAIAPTQTALNIIRHKGLKINAAAISNGIDTTYFGKYTDVDYLYRKYNIPKKGKTLLYLGRIDGEKHIDIVIKAFAQVNKQIDSTLIIVGKPVFSHHSILLRLNKLIQKLSLEGKVIFLGFVSDKDKLRLYNIADIFVTASTAELQGLVVLEAMASFVPVVAARAAALPELVIDGVNGYTFSPNDIDDFAEKMTRVLHNNPLREKMKANARKKAEEHAIGHTAETYLSTYNKALQLKMSQEENYEYDPHMNADTFEQS